MAFAYDHLIDENSRDVQRGINVLYRRLRILNADELLQIFDAIENTLGRDIPRKVTCFYDNKEGLLFWKILESHFGDYEILKELANENSPE